MLRARCAKAQTCMQLEATQLTYEESQPWPFPSSLMLGFRAEVPPVAQAGGASNGFGTGLLASREAQAAAVDSGITQAELAECAAAYSGCACADQLQTVCVR